MKPFFLLLALLLSGWGSAQTMDDKILRMLEFSGAEAQFTNAIDQMIKLQRGLPTFAEVPTDFWDSFSEEAHRDGMADILPDLLVVYRDLYTEEELDHVLAYLEHPLTKSMLTKQIELTNRSMEVGKAWGERMATKITDRLLQITEEQESPADSLPAGQH